MTLESALYELNEKFDLLLNTTSELVDIMRLMNANMKEMNDAINVIQERTITLPTEKDLEDNHD